MLARKVKWGGEEEEEEEEEQRAEEEDEDEDRTDSFRRSSWDFLGMISSMWGARRG